MDKWNNWYLNIVIGPTIISRTNKKSISEIILSGYIIIYSYNYSLYLPKDLDHRRVKNHWFSIPVCGE
jgi:hypothetical protein